MKMLIAFALWTIAASVNAQAPCSPKDLGPFLATKPTLTMDFQEESLIGTRAEIRLNGQVGASGADAILLEVMPNYQFMNPEDMFRFVGDGSKNYLETYKMLDRDGPTASLDDDINIFSFTLKCTVLSNTSDMHYYDTMISVLDVNDNAPQFVSNMSSVLTVNELTPTGLPVLTLKAEDKDLLSNLSFAILARSNLNDDLSSRFQVDLQTGELSVKDQLDYETLQKGRLVLTVTDGGSPVPKTATATIEVIVEDGDDQGPVFLYDGCWTHGGRCAWPKYTTSTVLKKDKPITVMPVPNKAKAVVAIKARDLDHSANPISFFIASTIPPGSESMFRLEHSATSNGEYVVNILPNQNTTVKHGFEIFLKAEEQSNNRRFEVAMIFFEDPVNACSSSISAGQTGNNISLAAPAEKYTEPVVALIVVVAILATFVVCLAVFICYTVRKSSSFSNDVNLTRM